jgi:murein L,D-transpeptidase YafK
VYFGTPFILYFLKKSIILHYSIIRLKRFLTGCFLAVFILPSFARAQSNDSIRDLKVIKETKARDGTITRVIQYYKGNLKVTETTISPPFPGLNERIPIDPDTLDHDSMMVYVDKTDYYIALIYKRKRIRQYRAVFGPDRLKDKMMEGDRCTPEGWFKVVAKKYHPVWQRFILLNYPNDSSYVRFKRRKAEGLIPQNARIGGSIGIHGIFKSGARMVDLGIGWTDGCISLKPDDIEDLYRFVWPGTRVYIKR